ncbi:MAG: ABC transporter permease [Culicoidibacterales bacterium]
MRKYIYVFITNFQMTLTYKLNFITSIFSSVITIVISFFLWKAVYAGSDMQSIGGYTENQMLRYIIFANMLAIVFSFDSVVRLGGLVRSGKLTTMILRPICLLGEFLASFLGQKIMYIVFVFICIIFLSEPSSQLYLRLVYLGVSFTIFFLLMAVISNVGFWLIQMWPMRPVISGLYMLLGGLFFPLNLLPGNIYVIIQYNPFAFFGFHITNILQGMYSNETIYTLLVVSIFWISLLYGIYKLSLNRGLKKYEGMGA